MKLCRYIRPVGQGGFSIERIEDFVTVFDCGSVSSPQVVEKWIDKLQSEVDHVNVLFISHFDKDHVNCIKYLLNKVSVLKVITPYIPTELRTAYSIYTNGAYSMIMQLFNDIGVESEEVGKGEVNKKPYYYRDIWEWIAKSMLSPVDFAKVTINLQNRGVDLKELELNSGYVDSQKENINDSFKDVFGQSGPNAKGLIVLSQKCKDTATKLSLIFHGCEWCNYSTSRIACYVSSCLYVGDADLKNRDNKKDVKDFLKNNQTESPLMLMQIPHHGSKYNVGARFETDFTAKYYFVNDINTKRIQNNQRLYNSLMLNKALLAVGDNCQDMIVTETEVK